MNCDKAPELITAFVDNELDDAERQDLEAHLRECAGCRRALEDERDLKREIREFGASLRAPAELRERIITDRRIFPENIKSGTWRRTSLWFRPAIWRPVAAVALLFFFAFVVLHFLTDTKQPIALAALDTYTPLVRGELPLITAVNPQELQQQLARAVDSRFKPMGYDLEAMKLHPVAGAVHEVNGRKLLVAVYRGEGGSLLCYTFLGSEADAPPHAARFFDPDIKMNFYAFSQAGINAILHREGDVICILAAEMPMDELLALVRSKARPT